VFWLYQSTVTRTERLPGLRRAGLQPAQLVAPSPAPTAGPAPDRACASWSGASSACRRGCSAGPWATSSSRCLRSAQPVRCAFLTS